MVWTQTEGGSGEREMGLGKMAGRRGDKEMEVKREVTDGERDCERGQTDEWTLVHATAKQMPI